MKIAEIKSKLSICKLFYALCMILWCIADQRIQTCYDFENVRYSFIFITGIVLSLIILSNYNLKSFLKWQFYLWYGIMLCIIPIGYQVIGGRYFVMAWYTYGFLWLLILLLGIVLGKTIYQIFQNRPQIKWQIFLVWFILFSWIMLSRSNLLWPILYMILFGCLYLTEFDSKKKKELFDGTLDGLIAAFFLMQGWCFVFRPYDVSRYHGIYSNSNMNALFYLMIFCAFMVKYYQCFAEQKKKFLQFIYLFMSATVVSFTLLTMGRAALLAEAGVAFLALIFCLRQNHSWFINLVKQGTTMVLCIIVSFPMVFGAVRYLPPVFHHPVWFWYEYREESVHSWDPWNSEKYIDIDEVFAGFLIRAKNLSGQVAKVLDYVSVVQAEDVRVTEPVLPEGASENMTRPAIYRYFWKALNLNGHRTDEYGVSLSEEYYVNHAHNVYLQYGIDFGILAMLLLVIIIIMTIILAIKNIVVHEAGIQQMCSLLYTIAFAIFGMFEYCWGAGRLAMLLFYFMFFWQIQKEGRDIQSEGNVTMQHELN